MDRRTFGPADTVQYIWTTLGLPKDALESLNLPTEAEYCPSSFKVGHLAQASIALSALSAALVWSAHHEKPVPSVTVSAKHACAEFKSERLYVLNGKAAPSTFGTIGGLHKTRDGHIRMHDGFRNHREIALRVLGLREGATREDVAQKMLQWNSIDLETKAIREGAVMAALRSFQEWDALPQSRAVADLPILLDKIADGTRDSTNSSQSTQATKCLQGIRVVEMSRVIAAPVAGKTLAAHGADVVWITSPSLPDLPDVDIDVSRGKRTVQLDIKRPTDKKELLELLRTADVFIQGYRPGSLAAQGLSNKDLVELNPNLIIASLSAYGPDGPWSQRRGFDSLVQTCSGINVADAERYGSSETAMVLPCQALDHGSGYLLATGVIAALYKRTTEGGAYEVRVSLAGVMRYLRSLGQYEGKSGFDRRDIKGPEEAGDFLETRLTEFGELKAVKHAAHIDGVEVGWVHMPKPLGRDNPVWLPR
ncbi:CoA-transferase family III domain-containing protein [Boeremia exigua]|uniref:CoA-transferase family III domain-containing protein n=1 Tax=Boeremia exigua TaxID=749465 RepID=UPI001E8E5C63|nr:CoA-transferase family III domain-containing protein [Boeremia exigua]KAH6625782.1 CoA-transferase family III domain-containing protein [Boeremia exigua]